MGRVSKEQSLLNHVLILKIACRLFREYGVEAVSIAEIMQGAGLTVGGFYKHFESKEVLVEEAFKLAFEQSSTKWEEVSSPVSDSNVDGLVAIVEHYFKTRPLNQSCPILSFSAETSKNQKNSKVNAIYLGGVLELFEQFKKEALKDPKFSQLTDQRQDKIMVLFAAMLGTGMLKRSISDNAWIKDMELAVLNALRH